ncbi:helix loop helix domain [Rhizoctonia solani]|uniref:Helix loop helix domain n=1 Tax=Rhizoctonia solani TaxID=456999 RepID=A0A8H7M6E4_9AGAM|nr:helix loop helix domain [Rhizoctonia solani]
MPDLNLDFPNFDLFVATGDPNNAASNQMQMDSLSGPHSTHPSPMLNPIPDHTQGYSTPQMVGNAEIARLQHHIEQQRRLNELNQLQNRILQQQLEIMGCPPPTPHVPVGYQGLITPGGVHQFACFISSWQSCRSIPFITLSRYDTPLNGCDIPSLALSTDSSWNPHGFSISLDFTRYSALSQPPSIIWPRHSICDPIPSSKKLPPLPSPSFGPSRSKRSATSDVEAVRKRASPLVKPTPPSKAATTPRFSTPEPPPIWDDRAGRRPPELDTIASRSSPGQEVDTIMEQPESADATPAASTNGSPSLAPVTPASLMNLGHNATQPTGLRHGPDGPQLGTSDLPSETASASRDATTSSKKDKTKEANHVFKVPKGKVAIPKAGTSVRQSPAILPMISPAIKSGRAVALGINPSSSNSSYGPDGRKTSHKAAEQKRRDSLKAGFDDLRLLLPPITLSACAELDPGAAPPRGPPRNVPGGEDNPNRAVSKLALLRFSNEWIVKLGRRVERRDSAIEELKKEIQMLREQLGPNADLPPGCDLDANIDAIEEDNEENNQQGWHLDQLRN